MASTQMPLKEHHVKSDRQLGRRDFLKFGLRAGGGAIALGAGAIPIKLLAQDDRVSPDEPLAQAMGYVEVAADADTEKFPKRAGDAGAEQFCHNCALFAGAEGDEYGPCSIFQNRLVSSGGWCNAWVAKS